MEFIKIIGTRATLGTNDKLGHPEDLEGPEISVSIRDFEIASTCVSNADFKKFVDASAYVSEAEVFGNSFIFNGLMSANSEGDCCRTEMSWWSLVEGASWKSPLGIGSSIDEIMNHPVVHVSYKDALAYCEWSNTRLPNEIEWEYAARGGFPDRTYPWGNKLIDGIYRANTFQGTFPLENTADDGYESTAPVTTFEPNGFGLYQMIGNVWEWQSHPSRIILSDLKVLYEEDKLRDLNSSEFIAVRGGSFLCHESYCNRYRSAARNQLRHDTSASNLGFRVIKKVIK